MSFLAPMFIYALLLALLLMALYYLPRLREVGASLNTRWLRWSSSLTNKKLAALELTLLALLCLFFLGNVMIEVTADGTTHYYYEPQWRFRGVEHERLSGVVIPYQLSLQQQGRLTAWNPFVGVGEPTFNNPFNYLFNPVASLPVLLFGANQGTKLAMALHFLFAGWGAWALGYAMGLNTVARVMAGALYMLSGQIIAKYTVGHFQLGLSLAWVPWVLAGLWLTLHSQKRWPVVLTAVSFALLFCSGNLHYVLNTLVCCAIIIGVHLIKRDPQTNRLALNITCLRRSALAGSLALGLSMIQFWPIWTVRDYIWHPGNPTVIYRHHIGSALANFFVPGQDWQALATKQSRLFLPMDYSYIGVGLLFFLALGLPFIIRPTTPAKRRYARTAPWIALVLFLVMLIWGAGQTSLLQWLYANIPLLAQFRHLGRANAVAALWLLILAGFALDQLWQRASNHASIHYRRLLQAGLLIAIALTGYDVLTVNEDYLRFVQYDPAFGDIYNYVEQHQADAPPENRDPFSTVLAMSVGQEAYTANYALARNWDMHEGWQPGYPNPPEELHGSNLQDAPRYAAVNWETGWTDNQFTRDHDYRLLRIFETSFGAQYHLYELPNALPYTFITSPRHLNIPTNRLDGRFVINALLREHLLDRVTVEATRPEPDERNPGPFYLVIQETHFPGWRVLIDDQPAETITLKRFTAVEMRSGTHRYNFYFEPPGLSVGIVATALTSGLMLVYIFLPSLRRVRPPVEELQETTETRERKTSDLPESNSPIKKQPDRKKRLLGRLVATITAIGTLYYLFRPRSEPEDTPKS